MPSQRCPSRTRSRNSERGQVAMMFMAVFMVLVALAGLVVDGTCVKVLAWYDNEIGYVHRMIELAQKVGASL